MANVLANTNFQNPPLTDSTKDATAEAGDILSDKSAYVKGKKVAGSMANNGGATKAASTVAYDSAGKKVNVTIPSNGYYSTTSKVSVEKSKIDAIAADMELVDSGEDDLFLDLRKYSRSILINGTSSSSSTSISNIGLAGKYALLVPITISSSYGGNSELYIDSNATVIKSYPILNKPYIVYIPPEMNLYRAYCYGGSSYGCCLLYYN